MGMPVEEKAPKSFEEMEAAEVLEVVTAPVVAETAECVGE